jgi:hypothetical protein
MIAGVLLLEAAIVLEAPRPTVAPIPPVHTYNVQFIDGTQTALEGTHIAATSGFCVEVWLNGRVDTIACQVRYITEKLEGPTATPPDPSPSLEARR